MNGNILVDLDGTLAEYTSWQGIEHIGRPIPAMVAKIVKWLSDGIEVRIFTARAAIGEQAILYVKQWLKDNNLPDMIVTNCKDMSTLEIWDDRAVRVVKNTGMRIEEDMSKEYFL